MGIITLFAYPRENKEWMVQVNGLLDLEMKAVVASKPPNCKERFDECNNTAKWILTGEGPTGLQPPMPHINQLLKYICKVGCYDLMMPCVQTAAAPVPGIIWTFHTRKMAALAHKY